MESNHDDPVSYYKKLEAEINRTIHSSTNSREFILAFGKAMDSHLRQARIRRRFSTRSLNRLDLPNKDEIAALSVRIVDYEEKLDLLDEAIYELGKKQQENRDLLKRVRKSSEELLAILKDGNF
jgi:hypothetical protein